VQQVSSHPTVRSGLEREPIEITCCRRTDDTFIMTLMTQTEAIRHRPSHYTVCSTKVMLLEQSRQDYVYNQSGWSNRMGANVTSNCITGCIIWRWKDGLHQEAQKVINLCFKHLKSICFVQGPTRCTCTLYFSYRYLYMFRVLFAPIIRSTTAAYSHGCVYGLVYYCRARNILVWR
jgi:hypothetical protein